MNKGDSAATLTLKEFYDVAILFAQSIPHPKPVTIKLFYTSSDPSSAKGDGSDKKGGKGKGAESGRDTWDNRYATLDGTRDGLCLRTPLYQRVLRQKTL